MTRLAIAAIDEKRRVKSRRRRPARNKNQNRSIPRSQRTPRKLTQSPLPETPFIELYQKEDSLGSHRVRKRLGDLGLDFMAHVVPDENPLKHQQLVQAGGMDQIPFLIDHRSGTKLYESSAILKYLDHEYGEPEKKGILLKTAQRILRRPLDRFNRLRHDADAIIETGRGTLRVLKNMFRGEKSADQAA